MAIMLYHCKGSRSLRPLWLFEEMGLDYTLVTLAFPPRINDQHYLTVNPLGTVPCLLDGTTMMTESVAICEYVANRYGGGNMTIDNNHSDYGNYVNWLHHSDATLTFPLTVMFRYKLLEPEERRSRQVAEDYKKFFAGRLRLLDSALQQRQYLVADKFTIADIGVGYALYFAERLRCTDCFSAAIKDYLLRLKERPAFKRACSL